MSLIHSCDLLVPKLLAQPNHRKMPTLAANCKRARVYWRRAFAMAVAFDNFLGRNLAKRIIHKPMTPADNRIWIATWWGREGDALENLLKTARDDDFVLQGVAFLEASGERKDLLALCIKNSDEKVRNRAVKLFKRYRNWDDATYETWLANQNKR